MMKWITALHDLPSFTALSIFVLFFLIYSQKHWVGNSLFSQATLGFDIYCECLIPQIIFTHYVSNKIQLFILITFFMALIIFLKKLLFCTFVLFMGVDDASLCNSFLLGWAI